jgi:hypothetical protein
MKDSKEERVMLGSTWLVGTFLQPWNCWYSVVWLISCFNFNMKALKLYMDGWVDVCLWMGQCVFKFNYEWAYVYMNGRMCALVCVWIDGCVYGCESEWVDVCVWITFKAQSGQPALYIQLNLDFPAAPAELKSLKPLRKIFDQTNWILIEKMGCRELHSLHHSPSQGKHQDDDVIHHWSTFCEILKDSLRFVKTQSVDIIYVEM